MPHHHHADHHGKKPSKPNNPSKPDLNLIFHRVLGWVPPETALEFNRSHGRESSHILGQVKNRVIDGAGESWHGVKFQDCSNNNRDGKWKHEPTIQARPHNHSQHHHRRRKPKFIEHRIGDAEGEVVAVPTPKQERRVEGNKTEAEMQDMKKQHGKQQNQAKNWIRLPDGTIFDARTTVFVPDEDVKGVTRKKNMARGK